MTAVAPDDVPIEMVTGWIEESYRLVAPKRLVVVLDAGARLQNFERSRTVRRG